MKSLSTSTSKNRIIKPLLVLLISFPLVFSSCYIEYNNVGYDGRPGDAYLALEWEYVMPDYLDAGTSDIPSIFEWGRYYLTRPGYYELYYEGEFWDGYDIAYYAWNIEYEIWRNPGTSGQPGGINGLDGANTYLTLILSPYGPYEDGGFKSISLDKYSVVSDNGNKIVIEQKGDEFSMRITYTKAENRKLKNS